MDFTVYRNRNLIDAHAHLTDSRFDGKREEVIKNLSENGIKTVIEAGADLISSRDGAKLSKEHSNIFFTAGIHPEYADGYSDKDLSEIKKIAENKKCLAIGEIGLDYHYEGADRLKQEKLFKSQLEIAKELKLPVVIHLREAASDMLNIVKDMKSYFHSGALFHCFSQSTEYMKELLRINEEFCFSYGGAVTFKNAESRREVLKKTPIENLLLETDCPYMTPHPFRGETNEPKYINITADKINELFGYVIDKITTANAERFYGIKYE